MKKILLISLIILSLFLVSCNTIEPRKGVTNVSNEGIVEQNDIQNSNETINNPTKNNIIVSEIVENKTNVISSSKNCNPGWRCISSKIKAYQNEDCTFGSKKTCKLGCSNDECIAGNICISGFKCVDNVTRVFQNEDCSWDKITPCELGCVNNECVIPIVVNDSHANNTNFNYTVDNKGMINFSGYEWKVKTGYGGPGPNSWGNYAKSVYVNNEGLHLGVILKDGKWYSSEVSLPNSLGYGTYEFEISTDVTAIDSNLVAAPFLYADDTHEIDVEYSKWANEVNTNAQFVVQPFDLANNMLRFTLISSKSLVQRIVWSSDTIYFEILQNGKIVQKWDYVGQNNFSPGKEKVHINFWMYKGYSPSDGNEEEFVVKKFSFVPKLQ